MIDTTEGHVTSVDGTVVGYHRLGRGPGLVVLHGTMESAYSHLELAQALGDEFTVHLPDRRGRGRSGPYRDDHRIADDVADLAALLDATGARHLLGVSTGAIICLEAALVLPQIDKITIFEPPLFAEGDPTPAEVLARFDQEMAQGRVAAAMVTAMKGAQLGPVVFNLVPRRILERLTTVAMTRDDRDTTDGYVPMRALAPTLHHDLRLVAEYSGRFDRYREVRTEVLLLGGSRSPAYLRHALDALQQVLPVARRVELAGLHHGATGNRDRGGRPERVAREVRQFFR